MLNRWSFLWTPLFFFWSNVYNLLALPLTDSLILGFWSCILLLQFPLCVWMSLLEFHTYSVFLSHMHFEMLLYFQLCISQILRKIFGFLISLLVGRIYKVLKFVFLGLHKCPNVISQRSLRNAALPDGTRGHALLPCPEEESPRVQNNPKVYFNTLVYMLHDLYTQCELLCFRLGAKNPSGLAHAYSSWRCSRGQKSESAV